MEEVSKPKGLKVIAAGLPRSATLSLKVALDKLGFGKCYHMMELVTNPEFRKTHGAYWLKAYKGEKVDFNLLFGNEFQSITDFPGCAVHKQLMDFYPDAKLIINYRDAEKWYESITTTLWKQDEGDLDLLSVEMKEIVGKFFHEIHQGKPEDKEAVIKYHNDRIENLKKEYAGKHLLWTISEGWKPLCEFLGVPVPNEPFPQVNDKEELKKFMEKMKLEIKAEQEKANQGNQNLKQILQSDNLK